MDAEFGRQGIAVIRGAVVSSIDRSGEHAGISYAFRGGEQRLATDVGVLADGGANLRQGPAIRIAEKDYGQSALLAHILADSPHPPRAFERFTGEGPAARLPKRR